MEKDVQPSDKEHRQELVESSSFDHGEKLIFNWVQTGVIDFQEFSRLNHANRMSDT